MPSVLTTAANAQSKDDLKKAGYKYFIGNALTGTSIDWSIKMQ
ncbi:hypothetical protein QNI16_25570 [Cytophagaceae bacterium YF14B1]|uniref:Uncharacterized protein n=1 Tax=Xanthocytophaga flava TaxID=3048013 RepID=A0AAE3QW47_9BACT|nr:hypothetical protein [Xanthocytophaga flavus]